jgi:hypothetical protein
MRVSDGGRDVTPLSTGRRSSPGYGYFGLHIKKGAIRNNVSGYIPDTHFSHITVVQRGNKHDRPRSPINRMGVAFTLFGSTPHARSITSNGRHPPRYTLFDPPLPLGGVLENFKLFRIRFSSSILSIFSQTCQVFVRSVEYDGIRRGDDDRSIKDGRAGKKGG